MANSALMALGILIIIGMFFFTNVLVTPQQRQQIELARSACGFQLFGIPLGQIGQALNPEAAQACQQAQTYSQIVSFEMPAYIIGFILIVVGLVIGGKKKEVIREIIREKSSEKHETKEEEEEPKKKETKVKYCTNCGTKVKGKFCSKCGEPV